MKEVLDALDRWQAAGEDIALATVLAVRGSAPRGPGARLALTRSAGMAGSVSGGCVETDVFERALLMLDDGRPVMASYGIADDVAFEVGLSCGGAIDVLIEPFVATDSWRAARAAAEEGATAAFVHFYAPDELLGRHLTVLPEGLAGELPAAVDESLVDRARDMLANETAGVVTAPFGDGEASAFVEVFTPAPHLVIIGATHAAMPLTRMAKEAGFRVTVADARSLFANAERFPEADAVIRGWPDEVLPNVGLDRYSYIVILSHDPKFDRPALQHAMRSAARYIGAMGSRTTHAGRVEELREMGFGDEDLARIHSPIGLSIGAATPEEIAVAILAEVIAVRRGPAVAARPAVGVTAPV